MSTTRVQLALNVENLETATGFYTKLFGVEPHKQRPGYANFVVENPPLKLVLFENPGAPALNHLGVEANTNDDVRDALGRFQSAGLETTVATQDRCCHAVQDKVFVTAPDVPNGWWEFYVVTDDDATDGEDDGTVSECEVSCAADGGGDDTACCA